MKSETTKGNEMKLITIEKARRIASEWHGGQTSALYAFSSSGTMTPEFLYDCKQTKKEASEQARTGDLFEIEKGYRELSELVAFAEHHCKGVIPPI